jgi:hypothetical protein
MRRWAKHALQGSSRMGESMSSTPAALGVMLKPNDAPSNQITQAFDYGGVNPETAELLQQTAERIRRRGIMTQVNTAAPALANGPLKAAPENLLTKVNKRSRRLKCQVAGIKGAIKELLEADHPQTVRQVFYALTVRGLIPKLEKEYHGTVIRLLSEMREAGHIPFEWITDHTRLMRKPASFTGVEHCLNSTASLYRRNLWASMPVYVEIWCEKDALAGVLVEETEVYDVPLMTARGYSSLSFLYAAAKAMPARRSRRIFIISVISIQVV